MRKLTLVSKQTLFDRARAKHKLAQSASEAVSFFDKTRHALITSIRGVAEASRMSGGDYDGDRAWISWNTNLIDCLPDFTQFVAENTLSLTTRASFLENKLWSDCCEDDIFNYMNHFRHHHRELGRLSEVMDVYIDKFGFDDDRTREISRAAFLQVRYHVLFGCKVSIFLIAFCRLICLFTVTTCK
jgi:RNA dependent RNA polymerase